MRAIILGAALVALAACGGGKSAPESVDGFTAALEKAGLGKVTLKPVEGAGLGGGKCRVGDVGGVETTVCEYSDAAKAKDTENAGLAAVGDATGASLAQGKMLLIVADRHGVDKDGKKIDAITKAFRGK